MKRRTFKVPGPDSARLQRAVQDGLGVTAAQAKAYVAQGAVYVRGKRVVDPAVAVKPDEPVTVVVEEAGQDVLSGADAKAEALRVLFEDWDVIAVDKAPGIAAQPTPGGGGTSLLDLVTAVLGHEAGLVHRLDRQTSGVTVFGKRPEATSELARAFREGTARKRYLAVVPGGVVSAASGRIDLPLSRDPSRVGRWRALAGSNGISAVTLWERLYDGGSADAGGFALLALYPQTGRTHQLRAHLRALGAPIAGDALYGGAAALGGIEAPRCLLHAHGLALPHPKTGKPLVLEAPLPEDLQRFFDRAGVTSPSGPPPSVEDR